MATLAAGSSYSFTMDPHAKLTLVVSGKATLSFVSSANNLRSNFTVTDAQSKTYGPYGAIGTMTVTAVDRPVEYTVTPGVPMLSSDGLSLVSGAGNYWSLQSPRYAGRAGNLPPAASPAPSSMTFSANAAATLAVAVPYTDPRITRLGATWTLQSGQARVAPITSDPSGAGTAYSDPTTAFAGTSSGAIEFWSDAPTIEVRLVAENARVYVDQGAGLQLVGTPAGTAGSTRYLQIVWTAGRLPRFYRIELTSATIAYFHSVYLAAQDSIWAAAADTYKGIAIGDSFAEGTGATYEADGCFQQTGRLLGIADWRVCGSGGTGFVQTSSSPVRANFQTRLSQDVLLRSPFDLVLLAVSGNDTGNTATLAAATSTLLTQIRAYNPTAKIIVLGTWRPSDAAESAYNAVDAAVQAGITASGVSCYWISQVGWITGSGKVGATTGTGNADFYTSNDGVHPSPAGHDYRAQRMAYEIKRALLAAP